MDDIRILGWIGLLLIVGVASVITLVLPVAVLLIAVGIFAAGGVRWCTTSPSDAGDRGGALVVFGALLMVPPLAWFTSAMVNSYRS